MAIAQRVARKVAKTLNLDEEIVYRGWFALNSLKRMWNAENRRAQLDKEKRYFAAHRQMGDRRSHHAAIRDHMADLYGNRLGWYSVLSPTTDPHCRRNHGKNFFAGRRPRGGFPGEVHPNCKCTPGAPWYGGRLIR